MRKSAIEQVRLEAFAAGYEKAQNDAAYRFGAISYEEANKAMIADAKKAQKAVDDHIAEHGEWIS
jgi:hypothetical protein